MTPELSADCARVALALGRLVSECELVMDTLGDLSESILPAVEFNLWYEALTDARAVLNDGTEIGTWTEQFDSSEGG